MGIAALIVGGIGAVASVAGSLIEADAISDKTKAIKEAAEPSLQELESIDRLLKSRQTFLDQSSAALEKEKQLLDAVDPALKEAGRQAFDLLKGKEAAALGPIRKQREKQRAQLESQLKQRLGSGFRTSSAGIESLTKFDEATDRTLFGAQQSTLQSFLGLSAGVRPDIGGQVSRIGQTVGGFDRALLGAQQNIQARRVGGAGQTGAAQQRIGQGITAFGMDLLQAGTTAATFGALQGGGVPDVDGGLGGKNFGNVAGGLPRAGGLPSTSAFGPAPTGSPDFAKSSAFKFNPLR